MNPNHNQSNEQSGLSLPAPYFEAGKVPSTAEKPSSMPNVSPESLSRSPKTKIIPDDTVQDNLTPISRSSAAADDNSNAVSSGTVQSTLSPLKADDLDLIEKEWVAKAKQIVEKTKEDPYIQTKEINHFKADYVKKRYNKDIKLAEE